MNKFIPGILVSIILAFISCIISDYIPMHLISAGVFAMLIGMLIHPYIKKLDKASEGIRFTSKSLLKFSIILMGFTLSFTQVLSVGKFSLVVMTFTLFAAFFFGNIIGKLFKMNWKLSNLISAGTGICGGSAIAAIAPTIDANDSDIAYAISATFIFDILMVILFPLAGSYFNMSDMGYGLWTGTAVNDTSSVVAAGYAYSDAAGAYATIVKLTRTLSIIPVVLIFSFINKKKKDNSDDKQSINKVSIKSIFPWFIIYFIIFVFIRTGCDLLATNNILNPDYILNISTFISNSSKFIMVMALGAIGLSTDFKKVAKSGFKPMLHGFIISLIVVVVSFVVQLLLGQI